MRIVLLGTEFSMNGAALLLFRWATHLAGHGHSVTAVHATDAAGPLRDAYLANGIVLTERLDVDTSMTVICNTLQAAPYVLQVASTARTLWWIHEAEVGLQLLMANPGAERAFSAAHAIIFPSAAIRDRVFKSYLLGVPDQRVHIIPPGLAPVDRSAGNTEAALADRPVRVISVGSIYPRKRPTDLIEAVKRVTDVRIECLLVGQMVSLPADAIETVRQMPERLALAGQVPHAEALRLIGRADIFALPSSSECLPIAPLEAAQRGKAVLLSDLPAHDGIWRHGVNCLMHPVGDVDLLAHSLRILATDIALRTRLGEAGRRTVAGFRDDMFLTRLNMALSSVQ